MIRYLFIAAVVIIALLYFAAAAYLYVNQRSMVFLPSQDVIGAPPSNSIYRELPVKAPTGGRLTVWAAPATREGLPTFVFFHGNASNMTDFEVFGRTLHQRGFGIVLGAYRGYSGNDGEPSESGLMEDARAILDAVGHPGPIILWGHSLGSGVAARMAGEGRADALVLESPYTALVDVAAEQYPYFPVRLLMSDRFDTAALVPQIKVPVLIIHSDDDPVVPFAMGKSLAKMFGDRATFIPLNKFGHYPHQQDLTPIVTGWMKRTGITP